MEQKIPQEGKSLQDAKKYFSRFLTDLVDLKKGVDKAATIQEIKDKKSMNGANAWMLLCSIVIASIGLDLNSPAVIIGAMLISPLMSPILGMGMAVGINDMRMLKFAGTHFTAAMIIAILTATIYFWLSPFGVLTPELSARTAPTFLDVFIAFFGGMAGIISIARKDISTTLPGVAIATALMPPLCTVGFGIANADWKIASSSFYLFFLNTFFVSIATFVIIRYLGFPYRQFLNKVEKRRNGIIMICFAIMVTIPSLYIFASVYDDFYNKKCVADFVSEYLKEDQLYLDEHQLFEIGEDSVKLVMKAYGNVINDSKIPEYKTALQKYGLPYVEIEIIPTSEIELNQINQINSRINDIEKLAAELDETKSESQQKDKMVDSLKRLTNKNLHDTISLKDFSEELKISYPEIDQLTVSHGYSNDFNKINATNLVIIDWKSKQPKQIQARLKQLLQRRLGDNTKIIHN